MSCTGGHTLREIGEYFDNFEVVALIYNSDVELERKDLRNIEKFLGGINRKSAVLILHGIGGEASVGRQLALIMRKKFSKGLYIIVPRRVGSSMVYSVLISQGVIFGERSFITPVDPLFYCRGALRTAALHLHSDDDEMRQKARTHLVNTAKFIFAVLETPGSIITDPKKLDLYALEAIVKFLITPEKHDRPIFFEDLLKMRFRCSRLKEDHPVWALIENYYNRCILELSSEKKRYSIERKNRHEKH